MYVEGHAILDLGCTKAVMSEHAKRSLVGLLHKNGIEDAEVNKILVC
jgi:hypothetical protein